MTSRGLFTKLLPLVGATAFAAVTASAAEGEFRSRGGQVMIPDSSVEKAEDAGLRVHTNIKIFAPATGLANLQPPLASQGVTPEQTQGNFYQTPASLACIYQLVTVQQGCNPSEVTAVPAPSVGSRAIAIVDAYHYRTAASDLAAFSAQFGLAPAKFKVVYANGVQPPVNADWNIEEALDIEWAHAMAPNAKIYLVEAGSTSYSDMLHAVVVASNLVSAAGGGEVSMSWGGSEFPAETQLDKYMTKPGVVYFAAAGDSPGVIWPSASPNVVSVGGTSISSNPATGTFQAEMAWQSGGGGASRYEPLPSYQSGISQSVIPPLSTRGTPDVAADADPASGVWVYDYPNWYIVGGTSVATPVWAGIVNAAGHFYVASTEFTTLYADQGTTPIVMGSCGPFEGYLASGVWNFCTGLGSPLGESGK